MDSSTDEAVRDEHIDESVRKVAYIYSPEYVRSCEKLQKVRGRATLVHSLIQAYELIPAMSVVAPKPATRKDLLGFHSEDYIDCLIHLSKQNDIEKFDEDAEAFGLCYDCPAFPGVFDYASFTAGATIQAATELVTGRCRVAVNWFGGWHHAKRDHADGYCYINDIVLGILKLRETFDRVLYVDLDLHHGDGVEDAFCATPKVLTWSVHKLSPGFYPGTGTLSDVGLGRGRFFTVNTPLLDGIDDRNFFRIFQRIASKLREQFNPKVLVVQLGADGLSTDPCHSFNLTHAVYGDCVRYLLKWNLPMLILGGGGYNLPDTAKCWTYLTSILADKEIDEEIPEHDYLMRYGPDYSLLVSAGNRVNENSAIYIENLIEVTLDNLDEIDV